VLSPTNRILFKPPLISYTLVGDNTNKSVRREIVEKELANIIKK